jgi:hypothetical protein
MRLSSPVTVAALNHKNTRVISIITSIHPSKQSLGVPQRQNVPSFSLPRRLAHFDTLDQKAFAAISRAAEIKVREKAAPVRQIKGEHA